MKVLSRDFTNKEKALLLALVVLLVALVYYQFIYKPATNAIEKAEAEKANLEVELTTLQARLASLKKMQAELDDIQNAGNVKIMPSYNNSKRINSLLNDVLGSLGYSITFSNVTRTGDQIRRKISMSFRAPDNATMKRVLSDLVNSEFRCLIEDLRVSNGDAEVSVSTTITFYETLVGGEVDIALPQESAAG